MSGEGKLYVGNISFNTPDEELINHFEKVIGDKGVAEVRLITDRDTGRKKGFGFVTLADPNNVQLVIDELDGKELDGRALKINRAQPRTSEPRTSGGRGGYSGGYSGGGGW